MKLKTFCPIGLRLCNGYEPVHFNVALVLVFSWAGVLLLLCVSLLFMARKGAALKVKTFFPCLSLWKLEGREVMETEYLSLLY